MLGQLEKFEREGKLTKAQFEELKVKLMAEKEIVIGSFTQFESNEADLLEALIKISFQVCFGVFFFPLFFSLSHFNHKQ